MRDIIMMILGGTVTLLYRPLQLAEEHASRVVEISGETAVVLAEEVSHGAVVTTARIKEEIFSLLEFTSWLTWAAFACVWLWCMNLLFIRFFRNPGVQRGRASIENDEKQPEEEEEPRSWGWLTRSWLATAVVDYEEVVKRAPEYAVTRDRDVDEFAAYRIFHPEKKNRRVLVEKEIIWCKELPTNWHRRFRCGCPGMGQCQKEGHVPKICIHGGLALHSELVRKERSVYNAQLAIVERDEDREVWRGDGPL